MARITVEDCLEHENNRFALVQLASKRTKQILTGAKALIADTKGNKAVVTALREIADGAVRFMNEEDMRIAQEKADRERALREEREAALLAAAPVIERPQTPDDLFHDDAPTTIIEATTSTNGATTSTNGSGENGSGDFE